MRRVRRIATWAAVFVGAWVLLSAVESARGDEASAKARLSAKGIRASRSGFTLQEETEFLKSVSTAYSLKRKVGAVNQESSAGTDDGEVAAQIEALTEQNDLLRKRLSQINLAGVVYRDQIGKQINEEIAANERQIALLRQGEKPTTKPAADTRRDENSARATYDKQVADARKLADHLIGQYAELSHDKEVAPALQEYNEAAHTSHALKPSHGFESALRRLETLEQKIVSGKIPLAQKGKSYYAPVMINGNQKCDMIVDAAAPNLVLPYQVAVDAGVNVDAATEKTTVIADGSEMEAKRVSLKSVSVGSFTVKNVRCDVLPAKDTSSKARLGKSFLSRFKFTVNAGGSELSLVRAGAEKATRRKKPALKHTHKSSAQPVESNDSGE